MSRMKENDFTLTYREMEEIRKRERLKLQYKHYCDRPFSEFLSPEARMAMKMVMQEKLVNSTVNHSDEEDVNCNTKGNLKKDVVLAGSRQRLRVSFQTDCEVPVHAGSSKTQSAIYGSRKMADGTKLSGVQHEKRCHDDSLTKEMNDDVPGKLKRAATISEIYQKSSIKIEGDITDSNYVNAKTKFRTLDGRKPGNSLETVEIVNADDSSPKDCIDEFAIEETARKNAVEKCLVWMEANEAIDEDMLPLLAE